MSQVFWPSDKKNTLEVDTLLGCHWTIRFWSLWKCPRINYWTLWQCSNVRRPKLKQHLSWWPFPPPPPFIPDYNLLFPFLCTKREFQAVPGTSSMLAPRTTSGQRSHNLQPPLYPAEEEAQTHERCTPVHILSKGHLFFLLLYCTRKRDSTCEEFGKIWRY